MISWKHEIFGLALFFFIPAFITFQVGIMPFIITLCIVIPLFILCTYIWMPRSEKEKEYCNLVASFESKRSHYGHNVTVIESYKTFEDLCFKYFNIDKEIYYNLDLTYKHNNIEFQRILCIDCEEVIRDDFEPIKQEIDNIVRIIKKKNFDKLLKDSEDKLKIDGIKQMQSDVFKYYE